MAGEEISRLTEEAPDQDAKIDAVLLQVAQDVAGRVNVGRRKRGLAPVSNTGSNVPPGSQRHAYSIARKLLTDAFPSLASYNGEDRKASADEAERHLSDLADNKADHDDAGASAYVGTTTASFSYGGSTKLDFVGF
jgi:hypothetical protein